MVIQQHRRRCSIAKVCVTETVEGREALAVGPLATAQAVVEALQLARDVAAAQDGRHLHWSHHQTCTYVTVTARLEKKAWCVYYKENRKALLCVIKFMS